MAEIVAVGAHSVDARVVDYTTEVLRRGDLVVLPTDTVYGLACDPLNPSACARVFAAKRRGREKPLALLLQDCAVVHHFASDVSMSAKAILERNWPGNLTALLRASPSLPPHLGRDGKIGLRVPDYPLTQAIAKAMGGAIAVTSANLTGEPPGKTPAEIDAKLGAHIALILDAGELGGRPSRILDLSGESTEEALR